MYFTATRYEYFRACNYTPYVPSQHFQLVAVPQVLYILLTRSSGMEHWSEPSTWNKTQRCEKTEFLGWLSQTHKTLNDGPVKQWCNFCWVHHTLRLTTHYIQTGIFKTPTAVSFRRKHLLVGAIWNKEEAEERRKLLLSIFHCNFFSAAMQFLPKFQICVYSCKSTSITLWEGETAGEQIARGNWLEEKEWSKLFPSPQPPFLHSTPNFPFSIE